MQLIESVAPLSLRPGPAMGQTFWTPEENLFPGVMLGRIDPTPSSAREGACARSPATMGSDVDWFLF